MTGAKNPLILAMDTATRCSSVALTRGTPAGGEVIGCLSLSSSITHSRRLITSVERLLLETEMQWDDIDGVAVGLGPGSFTGLRIGMASAKGFAAGAGKPLLGVSTLDALAVNCPTDKTICAVLDARKKQVYTANYFCDPDAGTVRMGDIRAVSPQQLVSEINAPVVMVGDAVYTYGEFWKEALGEHVRFAPSQLHAPSAAAVGVLCGQRWCNDRFLDTATAAPFYIRASDAELSLAAKKR